MTSDTLATSIIAGAVLCAALAWSRRSVTLA